MRSFSNEWSEGIAAVGIVKKNSEYDDFFVVSGIKVLSMS
jgi:hypothetical protein